MFISKFKGVQYNIVPIWVACHKRIGTAAVCTYLLLAGFPSPILVPNGSNGKKQKDSGVDPSPQGNSVLNLEKFR